MIDAVVLAGSSTPKNKAFIRLVKDGPCLLEYTLDAVLRAEEIDNVALVGSVENLEKNLPKQMLDEIRSRGLIVPQSENGSDGEKMWSNVINAAYPLNPKDFGKNREQKVAILPSDIPLATPSDINHLAKRCEEHDHGCVAVYTRKKDLPEEVKNLKRSKVLVGELNNEGNYDLLTYSNFLVMRKHMLSKINENKKLRRTIPSLLSIRRTDSLLKKVKVYFSLLTFDAKSLVEYRKKGLFAVDYAERRIEHHTGFPTRFLIEKTSLAVDLDYEDLKNIGVFKRLIDKSRPFLSSQQKTPQYHYPGARSSGIS